MDDSQVQVKISLSNQLNNLLKSKADNLGVPVTQFIKYLIIRELDQKDYPIYYASKDTENKAAEAVKNIDKSVVVDDIKSFFNDL